MPHVVLQGPVTPEDIWLSFRPLEFVESTTRMKVEDCYLAHDRESAIARCLTVERGFRKMFFLRFTRKAGDQLSIGPDPFGSPERSDGVKRLVGLCAWMMLQAEPLAKVQSTNIGDLISAPAGDE